MSEYKIKADGFKEIRKQSLMRSIPLLLLALTVGFFIATRNDKEGDVNVLPVAIPAALIVMGLGTYRGLKRQKALLDTYTLTIDDYTITRRQNNTPDICIYLSDIRAIEQRKQCFIVKGKSSAEQIIIPSQVDNYLQLENRLQEITPLTRSSMNSVRSATTVMLTLITLAGMVCVYTVNDTSWVAVSGVIVVSALSYSLYSLRRNKNIDERTRRWGWLVMIVIISVIAVVIMKVTAYPE